MENTESITLLVHLIAGAIGGSLIGALIGNQGLGALGSIAAGMIGGTAVGSLLIAIFALPAIGLEPAIDVASLGTHVGVAAAAGAAVTLVLGVMRSLFAAA